jgi:glutaredoxin
MTWWDRLRRKRPGTRSRPPSVVLYTRVGCHLCDDAKRLLEEYGGRHGFSVNEVDIDRHPELKARYDRCVPVVEVDGKVRFRGKVNEALLRRLLR